MYKFHVYIYKFRTVQKIRPADFQGKTGAQCGLGGLAVTKETRCPQTDKMWSECCGQGLKRLPDIV